MQNCLQDYLRQSLRDGQEDVRKLIGAYGFASLTRQLAALLPKLPDILLEGDLTAAYRQAPAELAAAKEALCARLRDLAAERESLTKKGSRGRERLDNLSEALPEITAGINTAPADLEPLDRALAGMSAGGKIKEPLNAIRELRQQLDWFAADAEAVPLAAAWQNVLHELAAFARCRKQEQDFLTFDDLEVMALELLQKNAQVRRKYQQRFRYIMVDEFQDTNDRQRQIIYLLCGDDAERLQGQKLFVVGDPKQSIYRFRGADVSVFARVRREIRESGGSNISLTKNFRSADKVLDACNAAFKTLLGEDSSQDVFFEALAYDKTSAIVPTLLAVPYDKDSGVDKRALEAEAVAREILALHAGNAAAKTAPVPYGEMAVLLRAMTHCDTLAQALQQQGIPYVIIDGKGFYECQEVLDLLNLFTVLQNRYRSLELAGVLRSPYFGLDDETLTKLFLTDADCLWDAVQQLPQNICGAQKKLLERAAEILAGLRSCAALSALPELWQEVWCRLHIDAVLALQEHGANKLANAQKLRALAQQYSAAQRATLGDWLAYTERLRAAEGRETAANLTDNEDAVSIMTIHKSKGLEFNTVFLPMLDTVNNTDTDEVKFLAGAGLGIKTVRSDGTLAETGVLARVRKLDKRLDQAERIRQLYVAMTRAEERLILSGITTDKESKNLKTLEEMNWLQQLLYIFHDNDAVEMRTAADAAGSAERTEKFTPSMRASQEELASIAPLPDYAASGQRFFTASALQTYLHCQRQYFFQQVLRAPELEENQEGTGGTLPAYVTGLIVHTALELYRGDEAAALARAVHEHAPGQNADAAQGMLHAYLGSALYKNLPREHLRELHFQLPMGRGLIISGVIDCLGTAADGSLLLVDYKTGAPPAPGEVKTGYAYQLALYKAAAEKLLKRPVGQACLHFLQNLSVWELPAGHDYLAEALQLCEEISAKSREEEFSCSLAGCTYCPYQYLCKQK